MPRGFPLLFALTCWLWLSAPAFARASDFWQAPPGCPSAKQADAALRKLTEGESPFARGQARVFIDRAPSAELRAHVELGHGDAREKRTLLAHDCKALTEAALLVIALAASELESEDASSADAPTASQHSAQQAHDRARFSLGVLSQLDAGSLPHATWGLGASVGLDYRRLQAGLEVSYFGPRIKALPDGEIGGIEVGLVRGALSACYALYAPNMGREPGSAGLPSLSPCVAFEQGVAWGRGVGLVDSRERAGAASSAVLGLSVALRGLGMLLPVARADVGARLRSPSFDVQGVGSVFRAAPVFFRGSLGLLVELN